MTGSTAPDPEPIAVVGMAGRFPGASSVEQLWQNLRHGVESISRWSPQEMLARGGDPSAVTHPRFVGAEGVLEDDIGLFDAEFFGYSPREAEIMDPQHRLCLESIWHAFDNAGYDPAAIAGAVGVFLGSGMSAYLIHHLLPNRQLIDLVGGFSLLIHNDKDFLAATVSHKLNLRGPSMAIGTACSTSLVAVHLACQSLRSFETDLAVAGGVSLQVPQPKGYVYSEDGIYSPDGRCRAFDADAAGTVGGSGVGVVLLKRWEDARRDGDHVHAVLLGSAVGNDGALKQGYTAPGVDGQAAVIAEAHAVSGVAADEIGYLEAHGTGTPLGDTIELEALTRAFRRTTSRNGFCAVGSIKTNIGHLDAAAGIAGLIKAVLAVEHGQIPPSLHFRRPNRHVELDATPFFIPTTAMPWPAGRPRTAGVSAFGIGGTNAHVVVREAPLPIPAQPAAGSAPLLGSRRTHQPLVLSARDEAALLHASRGLADHLETHPDQALADVAFTLGGRRAFRHRRVIVAAHRADAIRALKGSVPAGTVDLSGDSTEGERRVVLLLPGQGRFRPEAVDRLYREEPAFRVEFEACSAAFADSGVELLSVLRGHDDLVDRPELGQPAQFAVGYALARTLQRCGLEPAALLGHSLGEYVAATIAGVFTLAEAARLVSIRGQLSAQLPPGRMLAVPLPWKQARRRLPDPALACAADNGPDQCVLAGPTDAIETAAADLSGHGIDVRLLPAAYAYHSPAVDAIRERFLDAVRTVTLHPPRYRLLSNVSGDWATEDQIRRPEYWVQHMRDPVRFGDGVRTVLATRGAIVLEAGLAPVLSALVTRHPSRRPDHVVLACGPAGGAADGAAFAATLARAWTAGAPVRWEAFHRAQHPSPRRVPGPPYPLQRRRFWVDRPVTPSPTSELARLDSLVPQISEDLARATAAEPVRGVDDYPGLRQALNRLCSAIALRYLRDAGLDIVPGRRHQLAQLHARSRVLPAYRRFIDYLVGILSADGVVRIDGETLTVGDTVPALEPDQLAAEIKISFPGFGGLADLLLRCGEAYPLALSTPGTALSVLYPDGRGDLLERLLGQETVPHSHTGPMIQAVAELARRLAARRPSGLRVLEVGAGGGRLTWALAQALQPWSVDYLATDIGPLFVEHLAREAAARDLRFVRSAKLDISRDPAAQGLGSAAFDLILGLDVVHATADVRASLANLRRLLGGGGVLALVETSAGDRWPSMIWGLSQEWWGFTDNLRDTEPLLDRERWERAVAEAGYARSAVLGAPSDGRADTVLVLGQAPAEVDRTARVEGLPAPRSELPPKRPDPSDWLYLPSWSRCPPPGPERTQVGGCLVLADGPVGEAIATRLLERGIAVTVVRPGQAFAAVADGYQLDPARPDDYARLLAMLADVKPPVTHVIHAWGADADPTPLTLTTVEDRQVRSLHSLLFLAQAEGGRPVQTLRRVLAVTSGAQEVLGGDLMHPEQAMLNAAVKVIPMEYPDLVCHAVDVPAQRHAVPEPWLVDRIIDELFAIPDAATVAYRGRHRWRPSFVPHPASVPSRPAPGGVYLITGGLGGVGLAIGEYLARLPAKLVITGRTALPPRDRWDELSRSDPDGPRATVLRRLLAAEAAGAQIEVMRADVTNRDEMRAVVERTVTRFGPVTGVIHAAGVTDHAGMIQRRNKADTDAAIAAKVLGALVLDEVLSGQDLEFFVLCSSLGPILHKLKFGEVGYVAGNEFANAFAAARAGRGHRNTVAIAWTDWLQAGMWARAQQRLGRYEVAESLRPLAVRPTDDLLRGITNAEGVDVFTRILADGAQPQVIVSTQDLAELLARHDAFTTAEHRDLVGRLSLASSGQRPSGAGAAAPATTPVEAAIVALWEALLGVAGIGVHDNFFELGGDSLIALRFLARLREEWGVEHSIARMFEAPTVAAIAAEVDRATSAAGQEEVLL